MCDNIGNINCLLGWRGNNCIEGEIRKYSMSDLNNVFFYYNWLFFYLKCFFYVD